MFNNLVKNKFSIFWIIIIFIILFNYISFNFFIKNFIELEKNENYKSLVTLNTHIDSKFNTLKISATDYSQWDQTYDFIEDKNEEFIYENFRDDSVTIENINANFMLFINNKNEKIFSQFTEDLKIKDEEDFTKFVLSSLEKDKLSTIIKYDKKYYYLVKSKITKSDLTGDFRGYVYLGKLLTIESFNKDYESILKIVDIDFHESNIKLKNRFIDEVSVHFYYQKDILSNIITLKNSDKPLISFRLDNTRKIYLEGEKSILLFNFVVSSLILLIFFIFYLYLHQLKKLNSNLEKRVSEEIIKQKAQEEILIQQARLAEMGNMINNIAHQWRQPLNSLGLILQNIHFSFEYGDLTQESLDKSIDKSTKIINSMSNTIDTFRNFFIANKEKALFKIEHTIDSTLIILNTILSHHNIEVEKNVKDDIEIFAHENEFSQVLLNIITNAKDALVLNNIKNPKIEINVKKENDKAIITIEDNANGIKEDLLDKVFVPYFTTKEKGTGIGLYMSKIIIEQNMEGKIDVKNSSKGAIFTITLPL